MKNIGKYQGTPCYECTRDELYDLFLKKDKNTSKNIYIVDGVMVKNGIIIGYYDGMYVKEAYDGTPYFLPEKNNKWDEKFVEEVRAKQEERVSYSKKSNETKTENETAEVAIATSYEDLVNQKIDFGNYSKIVDEFFALLENEA